MSLISVEPLINKIFASSPTLPLNDQERFVVFSDFHMGNGSKKDDFRLSSQAVLTALRDYYLPRDYTLILNGDIEELQKFHIDKIQKAWPEIYGVFDLFYQKGKLYKIVGNHDEGLVLKLEGFDKYPLYNGIKMEYQDQTLFFFHGHQLNQRYNKYNNILEFFLRYLIKPLGIKNYSVAYNSQRQFSVERFGYKWSVNKGVISFIGHTHRPLFESLSDEDTIKYRIEHLCRHYHEYPPQEQEEAAQEIQYQKAKLEKILSQKKGYIRSQLYSENVVVPCLFNSGTAVGKRGATCIEFDRGELKMVHWYDSNVKKKFTPLGKKRVETLKDGTNRVEIRSDRIAYILNKIHLLT